MENEAMEIMENVTEAIVENTTIDVPAATNEVQMVGGKNPAIRFIVVGAVLVGAYCLVKKDQIKEKITNNRIKKLEKAGYTVVKNEDIVDETQEGCDVEVAD